jgi:signal transduction histidine kinase
MFADPLLEMVFFNLAENVLKHGTTVTKITVHYFETTKGLTLVFEDNGKGIPREMKERIFERAGGEKNTLGLFLVREILEITGITLVETGTYGEGARFEIQVPKKLYRFAVKKDTLP